MSLFSFVGVFVGVVICACCRICCWVSLFALAVGFVGWCWRECRRHDTPAKPKVARVPKARTEPWVNTYTKNKSFVGAALSARAFGLWLCIRWESAALTGLNKCISMTNPGLAPWAMKKYRAYGTHKSPEF